MNNIHMNQLSGNDQSVVSYQRPPRSSDSFLAVLGQRDVGCARMFTG